jgi:hypothetical protein
MEESEQAIRHGAVAIRSGNLKSVLLGLVSAIFVVGGLWMIVVGPTGVRILGLLNVLLFGFAFARFFYLLFNPRPSIVVAHDGIYDNGSAIAAGFVPWSEIEGIVIPQFSSQSFMSIHVRDLETIFSRLPAWKVRLMRLNRGLTGAAINIPVGLLRVSRQELIAVLRERQPEIYILPDDYTADADD